MSIHFGSLDSLEVVYLSIRKSWFPRSNQQTQLGLHRQIERDTISSSLKYKKMQEI